jgi:hypothetical protein
MFSGDAPWVGQIGPKSAKSDSFVSLHFTDKRGKTGETLEDHPLSGPVIHQALAWIADEATIGTQGDFLG